METSREIIARRIGMLALLIAVAIALMPTSASAAGHEGGDHGAGEAHDPKAVKEHLRHFSLANVLVSDETAYAIRAHTAGTPAAVTFIDKTDFVADGTISHVIWAALALMLVLGLAFAARGRLAADADAGVLPATRISPLLFYEVVVGAVWGVMRGMMSERDARAYFPIVGTLAVYIFTMNIIALIPFGAPATDNLNTNIGMGLTVFFATHYAGIRSQGIVHYAKHFMGPVLALAPLMIVLEIVGHLVRPLSLSLRLMGNMTGDHNVLFEFTYFQLPLVPLPVMFLGLVVCIVQTVVFVILSTVYLSMATAGHADEAHGH
jgi:F-type H+-transporting ATPase subunit a